MILVLSCVPLKVGEIVTVEDACSYQPATGGVVLNDTR